MNSWRTTAATLIKSLMVLALVLNLTSCGNQTISQEPSGSLRESPTISTKQFSEVAPPTVIQELRQILEVYRPQVSIVTPKQDEVLQDNTATVRFQVKDLPIFKDSQLDMGPHLHVVVDNQPYIAVYDLNQPLTLPDLSPGTHTLRVFASRPWHESFKNEGAYAQTTFHIFTKSDDNNPAPNLPLLTYSRPKGSYGAEPILLDFYLTNAPLHLIAKDNPDNQFADWRIRCTINGESFVLDRWQAVYLKGFKPGKNWVKLEFLDNQGNPVKNEFNSTVRLITYEPKGKDTLSKIVRGELSADRVRAIVDPNYTAKVPTTEPTPTLTPEIQPPEEKQPSFEVAPTPTPSITPTVETTPEIQPPEEKQPVPEVEQAPPTQLEKPKGGFFNRFQNRAGKAPIPQPTEISPSPTPVLEPPPEIAPEPEATQLPETQATQPEKSRFGKFFQRRTTEKPIPQATLEPSPSVSPTLPEIIETPAPETTVDPQVTQPEKSRFTRFFNRRTGNLSTPQPSPEVSPSLPPTLPEIVNESPAPEQEFLPEADSRLLPQKVAPQPEKPRLERFFNRRQYPNAAPSPTLPFARPQINQPSAPESTATPEQPSE
ncbi:hypothetical protein QUB80_07175 [Chlorogloeopsis sp. ULAP01]|uniref:hypothetical protein n=1 Tax=Chlorogloeopsis sp. ULAP01 TaxID=3056483 RepID=UPI0025AACC74|nr:hypothetical protein [Chlorogloeopsis sp. ULAP01]MDM9380484.1 hypothetical protein [Chlorogloeopsis sp. ULAP01]